MILSFSVLALGFLARPLGGIVLSALGDRFGRRRVFLASLFCTTAATILIGLLPPYETLGLAAPLLLVALRLVQGICLGGELPGVRRGGAAPLWPRLRIHHSLREWRRSCRHAGQSWHPVCASTSRRGVLWVEDRLPARRVHRLRELSHASLARGIARVPADAFPRPQPHARAAPGPWKGGSHRRSGCGRGRWLQRDAVRLHPSLPSSIVVWFNLKNMNV
jgi:Sugar (and other) transporter